MVPDWIATERAQAELDRMDPVERAATPEPIPMERVAGAVVTLVRDDDLAGRILVLGRQQPAR